MIEWISVKDDLPDEGDEVLVWVPKLPKPHMESVYQDGQFRYKMHWSVLVYPVTHWSRVNAPKRKRRALGRKA